MDTPTDGIAALKDGARHTLFNMVEMEEELKAAFGRGLAGRPHSRETIDD